MRYAAPVWLEAAEMSGQSESWSRRGFLGGFLGGLTSVGTGGLLGLQPEHAAAEPPPETTRLRVHHSLSLCLAPKYVAEDLLRGEGFTELEYVPHGPKGAYQKLGSGEAEIGGDFAPELVIQLDELFGTERVRAIRDLKGKTVGANHEFARRHPIATKRALLAILKAADICAADPEGAARVAVGRGYQYDYALQTMREIRYSQWREYDPEDSVRFYALRLHEAGMIKSSPKKIIAQGADWRFFNELKRELKG